MSHHAGVMENLLVERLTKSVIIFKQNLLFNLRGGRLYPKTMSVVHFSG